MLLFLRTCFNVVHYKIKKLGSDVLLRMLSLVFSVLKMHFHKLE